MNREQEKKETIVIFKNAQILIKKILQNFEIIKNGVKAT